MGLDCKSGYFTLNTSTGNQSITGLGFQPKVLLFFTTKNTSNSVGSDLNQCVGFAISSSARKCVNFSSEDGQGTTDANRGWWNRVINLLDPGTSTTTCAADLVSMDSDGFTINISNAPSSAFRVGYMAIGGSDITNTAIGTFQQQNSTGTQSITGVGFQPDFLFLLSEMDNRSEGSVGNDLKFMLGFTSGVGEEASLGLFDSNAEATSNAVSIMRSDRVLSGIDEDGVMEVQASLDSFDSDGFTIDLDLATDDSNVYYLAIKGGLWHVDKFLGQGTTGEFDVTDTDFTPKGAFFLSSQWSTETLHDDLKYSIGVASSDTDCFQLGGVSEDDVGTSQTFDFSEDSEVHVSRNSNETLYGSIAFVEFLSNGFTLDQTDAETGSKTSIAYFAVGVPALSISPNGITSSEAFGSHTVNMSMSVSSIASSEAFGQPTIIPGTAYITPIGIISGEVFGSLSIETSIVTMPNSIVSSEAFGQPTINLIISIESIISSEAFGQSTLTTGNVNITVNSIESEEAFGQLTLIYDQTVSLNSILSSEIFGTPSVILNYVFIDPTGIVSAESFGSPTLSTGNVNISPNGVISEESFGQPSLFHVLSIIPNSIESEEAFGLINIDIGVQSGSILSAESWGNPILTRGAIFIDPNSIDSGESFGNLTLIAGNIFVSPISIINISEFGTPTINLSISILSINSEEGFGEIDIQAGNVFVNSNSIASSEAFGQPTIIPGTAFVLLNSIVSSEAFGQPVVVPETVYIAPNSIDGVEVFGSPSIIPGTTFILSDSINSEESFGQPTIETGNVDISPNSIDSEEVFGSIYVTALGVQITATSIGSSEVIGVPTILVGNVSISSNSIETNEGFGVPNLQVGNVDINVNGIISAETFGTLNVGIGIRQESIISEELFGVPSLTTGNINVSPNSIISHELFGTPIIRHILIINLDSTGIETLESFGQPIITVRFLNDFEQLMEIDLNDGIFNLGEFAELGVYVYKDGNTISIPLIFDHDSEFVDPSIGIPVMSRGPVMRVQTSDFSIKPDKGDKVIIRGINYQVISTEPDNTGTTIFRLHHERTV